MRESGESNRESRLPRGLQWFLLVTGLGVAAGSYLCVLSFGNTQWSTNHKAFLALGALLVVLAFLVRVLPAAATVFSFSSLFSLLISLAALLAFGIDPFLTLRNLRLSLFPPKVGIWRFDPRFGFSHLPGAQGIDEQKAFRVTYTIDDEGCRVTPNPEKPAGRITCLGCSFTFGTGVEDDQCYPYFLATRHWTDYKVRNRAVTAYGTSHAYLGLIEELLDEEPPTLVLYGWIHLHKHRNYIRRNWVAHLANPWSPFEKPFKVNDYRKHPHFEIEDDRLVFKGVIGIDEIPEDQPDVRQEEAALSKRLLVEMVRLSREKNVPFVVVILPVMESMSEVLPEYLTEALAETDALWIDAREANRGFVKGDWHPNPETHAAIADLIADSTVVREILDNKPFPPAPLRKRPHPLAPSP